MRKPMAKKVLAASMAAAMTMSFAACGEKAPASVSSTEPTPSVSTSTEPVEEVSPYTVVTKKDGSAIDLGGMEIVVRDWFSGEPAEPKTDFEEAEKAYHDWVQEQYNFKITYETIGDWASQITDFLDYAENADKEATNYMFTMPSAFAPNVMSAAKQGLVYDLATLDCIDFSEAKYANNAHKLYTVGNNVYGFRAGWAEPRTGMYFNRRVLQEAGVDPDSIYDLQKEDKWTWEAFEEIMKKVQRDVDGDQEIDVWGVTVNEGVMVTAAVLSNGGQFVGKDANGNFTYEFESAETLEALEWVREIFNNYDWNGPADEDGNPAPWDYYQTQFRNGGAAFLCDQQYCATPGNLFYDMEDELGFVAFPKGPKGKLCQGVDDNFFVLPAKYSAEKAWNIAFAFSVYNDIVPGYETYNAYVNTTRTGNFDERAWKESVPLMQMNSMIQFHGSVPGLDLGEPFQWKFYPGMGSVSEIVDGFRDMYKQYIDEANQ